MLENSVSNVSIVDFEQIKLLMGNEFKDCYQALFKSILLTLTFNI